MNLYSAPQEKSQTGATSPATKHNNPHFANQEMQGMIFGRVLQTMDAGGYTYVYLETGTKKVWAAAPVTQVRQGSMVAVSAQMPMTNYYSQALERKFELIYFTNHIIKDNLGRSATATPQSQSKVVAKAPSTPVKGIIKAKDGKTIAEILSEKQTLLGQSVRVRGKVVKYSAKIMGKNWIHIRDSSTEKDLTITTNDTAKKGDIILAQGKISLDKDFGYGYVYEVLLEDSAVTVE